MCQIWSNIGRAKRSGKTRTVYTNNYIQSLFVNNTTSQTHTANINFPPFPTGKISRSRSLSLSLSCIMHTPIQPCSTFNFVHNTHKCLIGYTNNSHNMHLQKHENGIVQNAKRITYDDFVIPKTSRLFQFISLCARV